MCFSDRVRKKVRKIDSNHGGRAGQLHDSHLSFTDEFCNIKEKSDQGPLLSSLTFRHISQDVTRTMQCHGTQSRFHYPNRRQDFLCIYQGHGSAIKHPCPKSCAAIKKNEVDLSGDH